MERLGATMDTAHRFGWDNVLAYAEALCADSSSHVWRARHPDEAAYSEPLHLAAMLADCYDLLNAFYISMTTPKGRKPRQLKPYPRPWKADGNEKRIGSDALPVSEFESWYYGGE